MLFFPKTYLKKKKMDKYKCPKSKNPETLWEIVNYLMSLYIPIVGRHVGVSFINVFVLWYHISCDMYPIQKHSSLTANMQTIIEYSLKIVVIIITQNKSILV